MTLDFPPNESDPNEPEVGDLFPPTGTPLWQFTGNGWKRLGGGGLVLPSQAEAEDGTTTTARAWSSLRDRQALEAWYLTQAPEIPNGYFPPIQRDLATYLQYVEDLQTDFGLVEASNLVFTGDLRFGETSIPLGVQDNSARINGIRGTSWSYGSVTSFGTNRGCYTLTINSTAAFSLELNNLVENSNQNWEATIRITTTQVPASFSFTGNSSVVVVPGSGLADNPFAAGGVTNLLLATRNTTSLTARFLPATVDP